MLVYGGRNDLAYKNEGQSVYLDDLMLYDFGNNCWTAILQMGSRPEGRYNAGMYYEESTK